MIRLLYRLLTDGPLLPVPEFDADQAVLDRSLARARRDVRRGDWTAARAVIDEAGDDWELRGRRIGSLSGLAAGDRGWLDSWLAAAPEDPIAVQMLAATLSDQAGRARGSATADKTSPQQAHGFHTLSAAAAEACHRAMELAGPADPNPWSERLGTMFTGVGPEEFDEIFDEGRRRDPFHFDLHSYAVTWRCEKWFGSHESMFTTAREVAAAAPAGASVVLLPLFAHYEYALSGFTWGADNTDKALAESRRWFRGPEVQQEIDSLIAKWRAGTPHPATAQMLRQWVALFYSLAGRRKETRAVFEELGPYVIPHHAWGYLYGGGEYGYLRSWFWASGLKHRSRR
ncbi:hypothetical protein AB0G04_33910 [Actinoplanes sp. NPDC023801]|uniref:hypothetical protein n=1 Tax=Actinoplanes sp. NPDC023801 TaxID=3154595 RepID=UPI0033C9F361